MTSTTPNNAPAGKAGAIITDFYAIVTTDIDIAAARKDENVMAVIAGDKIMPLITTNRSQAVSAWENLMASDDPAFNDKHYRLIRIYGKREVVLEHKKT